MRPIPVVDLFAGPGGLGEGFQSVGRLSPGLQGAFDVVRSYEKDENAVRTLAFRKAYHECARRGILPDYFDAISGWGSGEGAPDALLAAAHPDVMAFAGERTCKQVLGPSSRDEVAGQIIRSVGSGPWVLVGGPPCQAYSIVGRARNSGNPDYDPAADERQTLYEEYLHVLAVARPQIFVLENVKGLLSASVQDRWIFGRMLTDLQNPGKAIFGSDDQTPRYRVFSAVTGDELAATHDPQFAMGLSEYDGAAGAAALRSCVVEMEKYGAPQARHRVILIGIRTDVRATGRHRLSPSPASSCVADVLADLPALRSRISDASDSAAAWKEVVAGAPFTEWRRHLRAAAAAAGVPEQAVAALIGRLKDVKVSRAGAGGAVVSAGATCKATAACLSPARAGEVRRRWESQWSDWYRGDLPPAFGVPNHESRGHIRDDILRYLFAALYASLNEKRSPRLSDFPATLLPAHRNVQQGIRSGHFSDRFRVQLAWQPSRTVTSHIHKDGHYYIHFDPLQARSLTVREAARLQTFPDSYIFLGPRTEQYRQVGNAVPPFVAAQIAGVVHNILRSAGAV